MRRDERAQVAAILALLAAVLAAVWAWRQGLGTMTSAEVAGLVYGAVASLVGSKLQASLGAVVVTSVKYAAITAAYSVWLVVAAVYAGWRLLRGRAPRGAFL
ncbi:hypothetical protein KN815_16095 [Streptomyces sp. 4503]|uniref:Uncharacterized protein n=1 Tax=Streptomyces niphimycinicus TaxID=2842201 RepID=A0ABS6CF86_9ACTN|nr:hypothetical protein [Streptomyces niphimycinicus]MBU3865543.1 hypothetical protein [Streptomyces niphimycinicus]